MAQQPPKGPWTNDRPWRYAMDLITGFEGYRAKPYKCPAGVCTIGFGTTNPEIIDRFKDTGISYNDAYVISAKDAYRDYHTMSKDPDFGKLNANQKAAFISMANNLGVGRVMSSTAWKRMKAGQHTEVPAAMAMWNKVNGKVSKGLVNRRAVEGNMYLKPVPPEN